MKIAVITDDTVRDLYAKRFDHVFSFPPGEASKTRATKEALEDQLLEAGFSRDTLLIGMGGGVVTDMAGYLAATFCRGVPLILIPTTLLAMVDAAIGGKNGVNTPHGKNQIGTFYHPRQVILRLEYLQTLPEHEIWNGRVEMMKAFLIAAPDMLAETQLERCIHAAIEIKRRIVAADPYEQGKRRLLNFGHTIGHALETVSNYTLSHGEAVAAGIVIESRLAASLGILKDYDVIAALFPKPEIPFPPEEILQAMRHDKKGVRFVMLEQIGVPASFDGAYCTPVSPEQILEVLYAMCSCPHR